MKTLKRRRKESRTDYKSRLSLLKSEKPRLVVRKTNRFIIAQIVVSTTAQDKVLVVANSKELLKKGWPKENQNSLKTLAAAYLTGYSIGKKSKEKSLILDIGLHRSVHGSRIFALLKGALDAGLKIPHNPESLPKMERIKSSTKTKMDIDKLKEKL